MTAIAMAIPMMNPTTPPRAAAAIAIDPSTTTNTATVVIVEMAATRGRQFRATLRPAAAAGLESSWPAARIGGRTNPFIRSPAATSARPTAAATVTTTFTSTTPGRTACRPTRVTRFRLEATSAVIAPAHQPTVLPRCGVLSRATQPVVPTDHAERRAVRPPQARGGRIVTVVRMATSTPRPIRPPDLEVPAPWLTGPAVLKARLGAVARSWWSACGWPARRRRSRLAGASPCPWRHRRRRRSCPGAPAGPRCRVRGELHRPTEALGRFFSIAGASSVQAGPDGGGELDLTGVLSDLARHSRVDRASSSVQVTGSNVGDSA